MRKLTVAFLAVLLLSAACSSIDCPVENVVSTTYGLYTADGDPDTLTDTLTVYTTMANGEDSIVLNMDYDIASFTLPISYTNDGDTFIFVRYSDIVVAYDSVVIAKENTPHFESVDCQVSYFHNLTGVKWTNGGIDSIVIVNPFVSYDSSVEHFHIYFKAEL